MGMDRKRGRNKEAKGTYQGKRKVKRGIQIGKRNPTGRRKEKKCGTGEQLKGLRGRR